MKTTIWKNDGSYGETHWDTTYRFAGEGTTITDDCIVIPHELWERMKQEPFYVGVLDNEHRLYRIDIANGWWSPYQQLEFGADFNIMPDSQNNYRVLVDYVDSEFARDLDEKNLLIAGEAFVVSELYFYDNEPYVTGGISLAQITEQWVSFHEDYIDEVLREAGVDNGWEYYAHCGYLNSLAELVAAVTNDNSNNKARLVALSLMCGGNEMKIWETVIMQPFSTRNWQFAVECFKKYLDSGGRITEQTGKFFWDAGITAFYAMGMTSMAFQFANDWLISQGYASGYPDESYIGNFFYSPIPNFVFQSVFCRENEQMSNNVREVSFTKYEETYTVPDGYEIYDAELDCIPQQYERSVDFAINWNGMGSNHSTFVVIRPIPEPPTPEPEPEDETCEMDFSAHTYEIIFDLFEKCEKYGFVLTDVKITNTMANGAVKYYRFNGYEDAFEYFNDNVRCRKINGDVGVWAVCSCIATRNLEYLPTISFKVTDILGDVKMKSNLPKKSKGRSVVEYDWSSENSKYTLAKLFIKYAKVVEQCNRAFQVGIYGNIDYINNYWNGSINN